MFVGIDVAKDKLHLARSDGRKLLTVSNEGAGLPRIVGLQGRFAEVHRSSKATGGPNVLWSTRCLTSNCLSPWSIRAKFVTW